VLAAVHLESAAARAVGITYIACPMSNSGPNSLQTMSDQQVLAWLQTVSAQIFHSSDQGGVVFHCTAGHDRAGLVAAYLRMKRQAYHRVIRQVTGTVINPQFPDSLLQWFAPPKVLQN
jgi:protein-tyrosine phosphatase